MKVQIAINRAWGSGWMSFNSEHKIILNYMRTSYPDWVYKEWPSSEETDIYINYNDIETIKENLISLGVTEIEIEWRG